MRKTWIAATLAATSTLCHGAKLPLYDNFGGAEIDRTRWNETEAWRFLEDGRAKLGRWLLGGTAGDTGITLENWSLNVRGGNAPKGFQAKITVTEIDAGETCAANPATTWPRARLIASYFNVRPGGPLPNDRTGDILAQIFVGRTSDSTDAPGVLRVEGNVVECTSVDCNSGSIVRHTVPLGTVAVGTPVTARIDWTRSANTFSFRRDGATPVSVSYTDADGTPSSLPFAHIALRNQVPNCLSGTQVKAGLAAEFDDVRFAP
jgi:hypothetical protein